MEPKTPLRLKFKLGGVCATPEPESYTHPTIVNQMSEGHMDHSQSEDDLDDDDGQDEGQREEVGVEGEDGHFSQQFSYDDASRERHKKSKKKKKKKEREKHKHKHHRERVEVDEDEPVNKKQHLEISHASKVSSKTSLSAFKELLECLLQNLEKKDQQHFFAFPVTDVIAPGYSSIINTPMDFSMMGQKVNEGTYTNLHEFKSDLRLICNNCMIYNQPDTIYYKAAKKLLHSGERVFPPEKILQLRNKIPGVMNLSKEQLGFDINSSSILVLDPDEGSRDSMKTSDNENSQDHSRFESIQDDASAEEILEQSQKASKEAAERLTLKKPISTLGFLRQRRDGTTTLNFLTGCEGNDPNQKEKTINLGLLTGKLTQGTSSLNNYRDDKRSMAKPVKPLYYGAFSSFCPSYDSTFANLTKEESEMVYATYGNETAVQYAESICDFSRDCDMAMHLVDQLLNLLTHQHHSRTKSHIDDRRRMQQDDQKINALLYSSQVDNDARDHKQIPPNFTSLHTLSKDLGIDTSFLDTFEQLEKREKIVGTKLGETSHLLECLSKEQRDRLSKPLPANLNHLAPPSHTEIKLAEKVTDGLISVARQIPPGSIAPVPIVRRALGITMLPIMSDAAEQVEVDIEETSSQESVDAHPPREDGNAGSQLTNVLNPPFMLHGEQDSVADRKLKEMLSN